MSAYIQSQLKNTQMFARSFLNKNSFEDEEGYQDAGDVDESDHHEKESRLSSHSFQFQANKNLNRFSQLENQKLSDLNNQSVLPCKKIDLSAFYSNAS